MTIKHPSLLLVGESDVGKTHYGAQLLRRLNSGEGAMYLKDSDNLEPFVDTMDQISRGLAGKHTPRNESTLSRWNVVRKVDGTYFDLDWPDYGGEQISNMLSGRRMPIAWREKVAGSTAWALMVRPSRVRLPEDAYSRPVNLPASPDVADSDLSSQSRLIEILQMLRFKQSAYSESWDSTPPLCVLLSCYDELSTDLDPAEYCRVNLPMLASFIRNHWPPQKLKLFGVSPLGQPLSEESPDADYVNSGPEKMGFVILENGQRTEDLLAPIDWMISASVKQQ